MRRHLLPVLPVAGRRARTSSIRDVRAIALGGGDFYGAWPTGCSVQATSAFDARVPAGFPLLLTAAFALFGAPHAAAQLTERAHAWPAPPVHRRRRNVSRAARDADRPEFARISEDAVRIRSGTRTSRSCWSICRQGQRRGIDGSPRYRHRPNRCPRLHLRDHRHKRADEHDHEPRAGPRRDDGPVRRRAIGASGACSAVRSCRWPSIRNRFSIST